MPLYYTFSEYNQESWPMDLIPTIAVFDFDGTLIRKDSFLLFARYAVGTRAYWLTMLRHLNDVVAFYLHRISNEQLKERLLTALYSGMPYEQFATKGRLFADVIGRYLRSATIRQLQHHIKAGHEVAVVSASIEEWVRPWAVTFGVSEIIATRVEVDGNGNLTGRLKTPNCYGIEKVRRFLKMYPERGNYRLVVYGDSYGDRELMELADERHWIS